MSADGGGTAVLAAARVRAPPRRALQSSPARETLLGMAAAPRASFVGHAVAILAAGAAILATAGACGNGRLPADCDYAVRRCRTICDYWCDGWGCYPRCWDSCWYECYDLPDPPNAPEPQPPPITDAASPVPPPGPPPPSTGPSPDASGTLCASCIANDECQGGLCILRGGARPDAGEEARDGGAPPGNGFCGQSCVGEDCPAGFACTTLGTSRQCLPTGTGCSL